MNFKFGLLVTCFTFTFLGCAPLKATRGYVPEAGALASVRVNEDTREVVAAKLGRPSSLGNFNSDSWYYISQKTETLAFFRPEIIEQNILAIHFNQEDKVEKVRQYGLEDGRIIDLITRKTPTSGEELNAIQQIFSNFGRFVGPDSSVSNPANAKTPF